MKQKPFSQLIESTLVRTISELIAEETLDEAREPRRPHSLHYDIQDHGFEYTGTKNGFRKYKHPETGDEIKHKFPTEMGNHSFHHFDGTTGKKKFSSPNTGDTEIKQHLESMKKGKKK